MIITSSTLHERGIGDLGPIAMDEVLKLARHPEWDVPGSVALLEEAKTAAARTALEMAKTSG